MEKTLNTPARAMSRRSLVAFGLTALFTGRLALVINFPGSTKAARECWEAVSDQLEHAMKMAAGGGH